MSERLKQVLDIVTSNSDEAIDDLLELMSPEDHTREEMGQTFEDTLGYDPTCYYDKKQLGQIADDIADDPATPSGVVDAINDGKEDLIESAYNIFADGRDSAFLAAAMEEAIEDSTGISIDIESDEEDDDLDDTEDD